MAFGPTAGLVLAATVLGGEGPLLKTEAPDPVGIVGGEECEACQYPAAVAMLDKFSSGLFCTGSLVHPEVVLFSAHCMDPQISWATPGFIGLGEHADFPARKVAVHKCEMHPQWESFSNLFDLAYCTLAEPVEDVPSVPVIMGCEVGELLPGKEVTIVGFGGSSAELDEFGEPIVMGAGPKRFVTQMIDQVVPPENDIHLLGMDSGGCFGDSGGPGYLQLSDGTWRVFGAASTLHPDTPVDEGIVCGYGTTYDLLHREMPWFEDASGFDLTPCHNAIGHWDPDERCQGFPFEPGEPETTWANSCVVTNLSDLGMMCGPPWDGQPSTTTGTDTGTDDSGSDDVGDSSTGPVGTTGAITTTPATDPTFNPTSDTDDSSEGDGGAGAAGLVDRGCVCGASPEHRAPGILLLVLALMRPRRRRPSW